MSDELKICGDCGGRVEGLATGVPGRIFHANSSICISVLRSRVEELTKDNGSTYCAYCGERFPLDAPDSAALVGKHIHTCEKHPIRHYINRANELESRATTAEGRVKELEKENNDYATANMQWAMKDDKLQSRAAMLEGVVKELVEAGEILYDTVVYLKGAGWVTTNSWKTVSDKAKEVWDE